MMPPLPLAGHLRQLRHQRRRHKLSTWKRKRKPWGWFCLLTFTTRARGTCTCTSCRRRRSKPSIISPCRPVSEVRDAWSLVYQFDCRVRRTDRREDGALQVLLLSKRLLPSAEDGEKIEEPIILHFYYIFKVYIYTPAVRSNILSKLIFASCA